MSEEEIIKNIKEQIQWSDHNTYKMALQGLLDLYTNQQKEIEEKRIIIFAGAEKVKQLEKGNRSLMESRIKWKNRYYKEKRKNKEYINKIREKIEKYKQNYKREDKEELYNLAKMTAGGISALEELLEENKCIK